jgi:hypothetical protein
MATTKKNTTNIHRYQSVALAQFTGCSMCSISRASHQLVEHAPLVGPFLRPHAMLPRGMIPARAVPPATPQAQR